jgi:3-hydroxy-5-methyl-1-naphthoate 3-O-methyltransferase
MIIIRFVKVSPNGGSAVITTNKIMNSTTLLLGRHNRGTSRVKPALRRRFSTHSRRPRHHHHPLTLTPERLLSLSWGYAPPLIIEAALQHRLFDLLEAAPLTAQELAARAGVSVRGVTAILNALAGLELLEKRTDRYALTPESAAFLVASKPDYHGGFFRHLTRQVMPNWMELPDVVRTGRPASAVNHADAGEEFFAQFVESLFPLSYRAAQALGRHLGIPKATAPISVLDLGAGSGVWGFALAQQSRWVNIRAVDWPRVLEVTKEMARRQGVGDRLTTAAGDLLKADFGTGHQVATLGHILHSEGRERCRKLLGKAFEALAPGGTIAISDFIPEEDRTGPLAPLIFAVNMLVQTEAGDAFTFNEISGWLREAGFQNPHRLEAPAPSPLILATRPREKVRPTPGNGGARRPSGVFP